MKDLIIVGAGGLARKLFVCLRRLNTDNQWNIKGFIDDNAHALDGKRCDLNIIGTIKDWQPKENEVFAMGVADPHIKQILAEKLKKRGARFETIVSPDVIMGDYVEIGEGSVVMTPYNVESEAKIGRFVTLLGSTIALDGVLGDYSTSTGFVNLTCAKIGRGVYIGSHAVILEHVTVGDGAVIGAGSIVTRDIPPFSLAYGTPARVKGETRHYNYDERNEAEH